jgi:hypothetical protein
MRFSVFDHSGTNCAHVSFDSEQTDSELFNSTSSSEFQMINSVFPYLNIPYDNDENSDVDSFEEMESPVPASAKIASPLRASIIVGDQDEINEDIPNAAPIPVVVHTRSFRFPGQNRLSSLPLDIGNVFRPIPRESGRVKCYIRRSALEENHSHPVYSMFAEDGDRFLMSAKRICKKFIISSGKCKLSLSLRIILNLSLLDPAEVSRRPDILLAEIKSYYMGRNHQVVRERNYFFRFSYFLIILLFLFLF